MALRVHQEVLDRLDVGQLAELVDGDRTSAEEEVRRTASDCLDEMEQPSGPGREWDRDAVLDAVLDECFGFGPLERILADPDVSDVLVNGPDRVYVDRNGRLHRAEVRFRDQRHLETVIGRMVGSAGRRIDRASPMVDARLPDGSRIHAVLPPVAVDGPHLSIRKFRAASFTVGDLVELGTLTPSMLAFLQAVVRARLNLLITGGAAAGKTTLLNALSSSIPATERIITVEDSAELRLQQPHVVRLETRPPSIEGSGTVDQRELVRNALRMRPDRIIVGEVRGAEAIDMLQAMTTGHEGSMTTLHANSPRDGLERLKMLASFSGLDLPDRTLARQVGHALDVVAHLTRFEDGSRRITHLTEVRGEREGSVVTEDLVLFQRTGVDGDGQVQGGFQGTGVAPAAVERFRRYGIDFDPSALADTGPTATPPPRS